MNSVDQTSQHPTYILPDFPVGERERKPNIKDVAGQCRIGFYQYFALCLFLF